MTKKGKKIVLFVMVLAILVGAVFTTPVQAQVIVDDLKFVEDVTIPDGTVVKPGEQFVKTWRVKNSGTGNWTTGYAFTYAMGEYMTPNPVVQYMPGILPPENTIDLSVEMTAPQTPGSYTGFWQMRNAKGVAFGPMIWVSIRVSDMEAMPTLSASSATQLSQTPMPQNFDIRTISASMVEFYFNGQWIQSTPPAPNGTMEIPGISGTINFIEYEYCWNQWVWVGWLPEYVNKCEKRNLLLQDLGIHPFKVISKEGEVAFYSYLDTLTFGMVGTVAQGTLIGQNGYLIQEVGAAQGLNSASVVAATARFALPVLVVSYAYYAGKVFVIAHPINEPVAIAAPIAPTILLSPIIGHSSRVITSQFLTTSLFSLTKTFCNMWLKTTLPKDDGKLIDFEESFKKDGDCNMQDVLRLILKIGENALKAGIAKDVVWRWYSTLDPIFTDLGLSPYDMYKLLTQ